jgi:hypothetical protein
MPVFATNLHLSVLSSPTIRAYFRNSSPLGISLTTTAAYLVFYSAFNKKESTLDPSLLLDVILARRGISWSLKEMNKVISLSGLTTALLSFLPTFRSVSPAHAKELQFISMNLLWLHSVYSLYSFYRFDPNRVLKEPQIKQISIFLGVLGQLALSAGYWGYISNTSLLLSVTAFGLGHFVTMEVDSKWVLQVRPFAYLPFPIALLNLYEYFLSFL